MLIVTVSEWLQLCWDPSKLAPHGDIRSSQGGKPRKLDRPPFEWKTKNLPWYPFQCVEWKATSVTAGGFYAAVVTTEWAPVAVGFNLLKKKKEYLKTCIFFPEVGFFSFLSCNFHIFHINSIQENCIPDSIHQENARSQSVCARLGYS